MQVLYKLVLTALFLSLIYTTSFAQEQKTAYNPINLSIAIKADFTDNRDSSADPDENFDISLKPKIDAVFNSERMLLDFYYIPTYRYRDNPNVLQNENEWYHDFGLNMDYNIFPRLVIKLKDDFNITDDPSIEERGTTLRRDSSYIFNQAEAKAVYSISRRSHLDIKALHTIRRYDVDSVADESDEDGLTGSINLWRQLSRTVGGLLLVDVTMFDYNSSTNIERGFNGVFGGIGLEKAFSRTVRGVMHLGWQMINYDDSLMDSVDSPRASLALEVLSASTRLIASSSYQIRDSDVYPFASQDNISFQIEGEWEATTCISLVLSGIYELGHYEEDATPSDTTTEDFFSSDTTGDKITVIATAGIIYRIPIHSVAIKLAQQYEEVDSDVSESFTRNNTSLTITKFF